MFRTVNKVKCLNERRCYVLADVIIFVYEVPCIFWHYINDDEVTLITLKKVLQSATAYFITKCDGQLLQITTAILLQSTTRFITNCDRYYKVRWIYYKLRQVLQSAMIITNCDSTDATFRGPAAQIINTGGCQFLILFAFAWGSDLNPKQREENKTFLTKYLKRKLSLALQKISNTEICLVI